MYTSKMGKFASALFRVLGVVVALASLFFVIRLIHRYSASISADLLLPSTIAAIVVCAILYSFLLLLIGFAWLSLIASIEPVHVNATKLLSIYAKTQVYKYFPSNVLHFVGRYAMARKQSITHRALAFGQIAEIILICLTAGLISLILSRVLLFQELKNHGFELSLNVTNALVSIAAIGIVVVAIAILQFKARLSADRIIPAALISMTLYAVFFIGNGLLLYCISLFLSARSYPLSLIGVATAAWLIGFVLPGAPGGIGVRDLVLISGLSTLGIDPQTSIVLALSHRIMTVIGDCMLACYGYFGR